MNRDLKKLASYLSGKGKEELVQRVASLMKRAQMDAPDLWEISHREDDMKGDFDLPEGEATPEIEEAVAAYLTSKGFKLSKLRWMEPAELEAKRIYPCDEGTWLATSFPMDPEDRRQDPVDVPQDCEWLVWEVSPGEYGYEGGAPIANSDKRIYGEY